MIQCNARCSSVGSNHEFFDVVLPNVVAFHCRLLSLIVIIMLGTTEREEAQSTDIQDMSARDGSTVHNVD